MARKKRKVGFLKFARRKLRSAEKQYKRTIPFVAQEARLVREALNTPHAFKRFTSPKGKALIDDPKQLKKKRIRPFIAQFGPLSLEIKSRRK